MTPFGNQRHYRANPDAPAFEELRSLIVKTVGLVEPLRQALWPLADRITAAFVYGSVANGSDTARSDVDLMVISDDLGYPDVFDAIEPAEAILARTVNPMVVTSPEWRSQKGNQGSFAARISAQPRVFVLGSADDVD